MKFGIYFCLRGYEMVIDAETEDDAVKLAYERFGELLKDEPFVLVLHSSVEKL